jgi:hypothetical protein
MAYYPGITNVVHLQLHKNNYFNIAKARRERTREAEEREYVCLEEERGSIRGIARGREKEATNQGAQAR